MDSLTFLAMVTNDECDLSDVIPVDSRNNCYIPVQVGYHCYRYYMSPRQS